MNKKINVRFLVDNMIKMKIIFDNFIATFFVYC